MSNDELVVYEVIDQTSDDIYYPLGIWLELDEAIAAIEESGRSAIDIFDSSCSGYFTVKVMKRRVGWSENGDEVFCVRWVEQWDDEADCSVWDMTVVVQDVD